MGQTAFMKPGNPYLPEPGPDCVVSARSLVKHYKNNDRPALNDFTLDVQQGEFFGLLGPNGAGKTTAISILTGLFPADSGSVRIRGMSFQEKEHEIKRILGLVPQDIGLYDTLTARENLNFFGKLCGISGRKLGERIQQGLEFARLTEHARHPVATFSTGMKRRLNLAVGLLNEPQLLVLDEPCVGIDAQSRHLIHEQLKEINRQGTTILYTTHYIEEAQELCSRIGIIDNGRLVEQGSPVALLQQSGRGNLEELFLHLTGKELRDT
ncbi:MAG: ABC transporter ATP-binding protein [Desulfurivibrionaceae bacterium]|jgi:ABC-2 type transport system ATP-binding protein|nr:ABC transporter ATP-binding protein [Desulfurivibrionaceae bacterium]